jgi:phosphoribosyl-AMP cyclohydrolase
LKKLAIIAFLAIILPPAHGQNSDEITSQTIGGSEAVVGVWDLDRTRQTATTPITTTSTLTVLAAVSRNSYQTRSESSSVQYMEEDQKVWTKGRCSGGVFSRKNKANPCEWDSKSKGILTVIGRNVEINYANPSYLSDTLTLRGDVMEGSDPNGELSYIKRK